MRDDLDVNTPSAPTALISWAHEDDHRRDQVAQLAGALRSVGIDADVDLYHLTDPEIDWTRWGVSRIAEADFVLIVASTSYKERWSGTNNRDEGAGAAREADALLGLFNRDQFAFQLKTKIVLLPGVDDDAIPDDLQRVGRFRVNEISASGVIDILRTLTNQPAIVAPPLGAIPALPTHDPSEGIRPAASIQETLGERDRLKDELNGVEAHLHKLPPVDGADSYSLPWAKEWHVLQSRAVSLRAAIQPLDAILATHAAELRAQTNALEDQARAAEAAIAPLLVVRRNGRNANETEVEGILVVENLGGGPAAAVVVHTDWGDAPLDNPALPPGAKATAKVKKPRTEWVKGTDPSATAITYVNPLGQNVTKQL